PVSKFAYLIGLAAVYLRLPLTVKRVTDNGKEFSKIRTFYNVIKCSRLNCRNSALRRIVTGNNYYLSLGLQLF
ncbi:hypothetical protein WAJ24_21345, partial [Acinetobacter baumannii]